MATPKSEATKKLVADKSSVSIIALDDNPDQPSHGFVCRKRPASVKLDDEPAEKLAKLDLGSPLVLGKAKHNILGSLSCVTEYISEFPCFMFRQPHEDIRRERKIEAIAQAVAYLAHHSMSLWSDLLMPCNSSFHQLYCSCFQQLLMVVFFTCLTLSFQLNSSFEHMCWLPENRFATFKQSIGSLFATASYTSYHHFCWKHIVGNLPSYTCC